MTALETQAPRRVPSEQERDRAPCWTCCGDGWKWDDKTHREQPCGICGGSGVAP